MADMFMGADAFNQPLDGWNTENVKDMSSMFEASKSFNQPIENFNTKNVDTMHRMFHSSKAFNQSIDALDVYDMTAMLHDATAYKKPLGKLESRKDELMGQSRPKPIGEKKNGN